MDVPWRRDFDAARDPYTARVALGLSAAATGGPFGNVSNSGTPVAGQVAEWVDATHIKGVAKATLTGLPYLPTAGGILTGSVAIIASTPDLLFQSAAGTTARVLSANPSTGNARWSVVLNDGATETGSGNAGSNFAIQRFSDAGALLTSPISIDRSTGVVAIDKIPEGTWTPSFTFATPGDLTVVYGDRSGTYVTIGNLVILFFDVTATTFTFTTASGNFFITGLPFPVPSTIPPRHLFPLAGFTGITKAGFTQFTLQGNAGATTMNIQGAGSGVTLAAVTAADMPSGSAKTFRGTFIYKK
jgi:hypothetical protein